MTARMSMSVPSSPAHTPRSLFLKMNCLHNSSISIINNAHWISLKTIDTRLSSLRGICTKALVKRIPHPHPHQGLPPPHTHTSIFKPWTISDFQSKFFILAPHLHLKIQGGAKCGKRKERICLGGLSHPQIGKRLFYFWVFLEVPCRD